MDAGASGLPGGAGMHVVRWVSPLCRPVWTRLLAARRLQPPQSDSMAGPRLFRGGSVPSHTGLSQRQTLNARSAAKLAAVSTPPRCRHARAHGTRVQASCADARATPLAQAPVACVRRRSALPITEAELRLIASAAIIGDSSQPVSGYSTPAASGMPSPL